LSEHRQALEGLLERAEQAHAEYEAAELDGVYDQAWPRWYATFLVEHAVGELIGRPATVDQLERLLADSWADQQAEARQAEPWSTYTARWLLRNLES
jgi:hypothetical protein